MTFQHRQGNRSLSYCIQETDVKQRVVEGEDVTLTPEPHNPNVKSYRDPFALRIVSFELAELAPGSAGTMHRQLHESTMLVLSGEGYTMANGVRYSWTEGDALQVPLFMWHEHVNTGQQQARYARFGTTPLFQHLGIYKAETLQPPENAVHDPKFHDEPSGSVRLLHRDKWHPKMDVHRFVEGKCAEYFQRIRNKRRRRGEACRC